MLQAVHPRAGAGRDVEYITRRRLPVRARPGEPVDQVFLVIYADPREADGRLRGAQRRGLGVKVPKTRMRFTRAPSSDSGRNRVSSSEYLLSGVM